MEHVPADPAPETTPPSPEAPRSEPRLRKLVRVACRAYFLVVLGVWALVALGADRWWLATAAMFGPAWAWALPLALLIPLAAILHPRQLSILGVALAVIVFPIGRLCIPWQKALPAGAPSATSLKVISLNADHKVLDPNAFAKLVREHQPDLVVLQGWRSRYEKSVFAQGWHLRREDELCLASRHPITGVRPYRGSEFKEHPGTLATFEVETPAGNVRVANLHLATPRDGLAALLHGAWREGARALAANSRARREQSLAVRRFIGPAPGPLIVAGDFNTPTPSAVYRQCWSDLTNAFSAAGWGPGHTHFTRATGVRIDHVLVNHGLRVTHCEVGPDVGSAHRPVIAELKWPR